MAARLAGGRDFTGVTAGKPCCQVMRCVSARIDIERTAITSKLALQRTVDTGNKKARTETGAGLWM